MGLLRLLFGKKAPASPGDSVGAPAGKARILDEGGSAIDLQLADEGQIERRAETPLEPDLEALATTAGRLGHEYAQMGDTRWQELKSIGQQLHDRGGHKLMLLVCYRVRNLGGRDSSVSAAWHGIGRWRK